MDAHMPLKTLAPLLLLPLFAAAAELPALRTEPIGGGSVFFVKNTSSQPLTAYLIELVNYPGSSYSLWIDEASAEPVAPGAEKRIQVANMTAGAVPDYMKIQAAIYADGSTAGVPAKVTQFIDRRRFTLATNRDLIRRLEKAKEAATPKAAIVADLKKWAESLQPVGKVKPNSQEVINQAAARSLVSETVGYLDAHTLDETLNTLTISEKKLADTKPAL
jgi:hypothetical protein